MTRAAWLAAASLAIAVPAVAATPWSSLLGRASDSALTRLSQPGAFFADEAVRIALPGPLKNSAGLMRLADRTGLTAGLTKSINDAAGVAAGEAKPIFRASIDRLSIADAPGIATQRDGATRYLQRSANAELKDKVRPLVAGALGRTGAFGQLDRLGAASSLAGRAGLSRDGLTDSVTDQAMTGIYKYMASEEARVRADPVSIGRGLLKRN